MKGGAIMSKTGAKFEEVKALLMKDSEFADEYEKLRPRYEVISLIIEERAKQHITQEELALRVGTQKSNISRLESGTYNPSLDFLAKIVKSLGKENGSFIRVGATSRLADEKNLYELELIGKRSSFDSIPCRELYSNERLDVG